MLTNTIILFLRDLLPMFIMFSYLKTIYQQPLKKSVIVFAPIILGLIFSVVVLLSYESISDLFEGFGIEWLKILLITISFIGFLLTETTFFKRYKGYLLSIASFSLLSLYFNSFLLYFTTYFSYDEFVLELLIGCVIGIGICVSFYFLFHFFMHELWQSKLNWIVLLLWSLFVSSQFSAVTNYLHQIDVVSFGVRNVINLSHLVQEGSEYGFFLRALTGFDTSPSLLYLVTIILSFSTMFTLLMLGRKNFSKEIK